LYEACLERMQLFVDDLERSGQKHSPDKFADFKEILADVSKHPNAKYFIYKSIIINNLFGVDIMDEAIEICKLRLFLKLVAQVDTVERIEPLPDIDFNIRAGNTLVGFATLDEVKKAVKSKFDFDNTLHKITEKAEEVERLFLRFRQQQTSLGGDVTADDKAVLSARLKKLEEELNGFLSGEYGIDSANKAQYETWSNSHKPFHWLIDFYGIIKNGGFDVIIGNPPYVEYASVRNQYQVANLLTMESGNLYSFCTERSVGLLHPMGRISFIVPLSLFCTPNMISAQKFIQQSTGLGFVSYYSNRPDQLFEGAQNFLSIFVLSKNRSHGEFKLSATKLMRWSSEIRNYLFSVLEYVEVTKNNNLPDYAYPKFHSSLENQIAKKLFSVRSKISHIASESGRSSKKFTYCYGGVYWTKARDFDSPVVKDGKPATSTADRPVYIKDSRLDPTVASAILNSTLHFWFWVNFSDCRNKTYKVMLDLPFSVDFLSKDNNLMKLGRALMKEYRANAKRRIRRGKGGTTEFDEFYPKKSKPLIDEIDRELAAYYGFTEEELDFIINYDIKYRMG
ncbi:MAG: Eco57I restriction-modification methylase domain-containing protein, partial [Planctomycetota bacterium]|nr:Eco57I restriction-modification methylase domain-containing protein [Planctomycetota bacterium]